MVRYVHRYFENYFICRTRLEFHVAPLETHCPWHNICVYIFFYIYILFYTWCIYVRVFLLMTNMPLYTLYRIHHKMWCIGSACFSPKHTTNASGILSVVNISWCFDKRGTSIRECFLCPKMVCTIYSQWFCTPVLHDLGFGGGSFLLKLKLKKVLKNCFFQLLAESWFWCLFFQWFS